MGKKGRPASSSEGAHAAVESVRRLLLQMRWSEARLAKAAGVSQSAAHRALNSVDPRWTPALIALSDYAKNGLDEPRPSVDLPTPSLAALARLWNGTEEDGDRIARLLSMVEEFRKPCDKTG